MSGSPPENNLVGGYDVQRDLTDVNAPLTLSQMPVKKCSTCNVDKPLTAEFYYRNSHSPDGFHNECKDCRSNRTLLKRKEVNARLSGQILELESISVDRLAEISKPRSTQSDIPHEAEVYEELMG